MRDYSTKQEILVVLLEMCEDVARRAREVKKQGRTISLGLSYSKGAFGGGFHRSCTIEEPTNDTLKIFAVCKQLLHHFYNGKPVRKLTVTLSNIESEYAIQLSLFDEGRWRSRKLGETMDRLRTKYGSTAILRAVSYTDAGTARMRAALVGGHKQ